MVEIFVGGKWVALMSARQKEVVPGRHWILIPFDVLPPEEECGRLTLRIDGRIAREVKVGRPGPDLRPNGSMISLLAWTE